MLLNREAYEELIAQDVEALNGALSPHSLERQHIEQVLRHSVKANYNDQGKRIEELEAQLESYKVVGVSAGKVLQDYLQTNAKLRTALRELVLLFEEWMQGPLYRSGVVYNQPSEYPPAIVRARAMLAER